MLPPTAFIGSISNYQLARRAPRWWALHWLRPETDMITEYHMAGDRRLLEEVRNAREAAERSACLDRYATIVHAQNRRRTGSILWLAATKKPALPSLWPFEGRMAATVRK